MLLVDLVELGAVELGLDIVPEVLLLELLPPVPELLDGPEGEHLLFLGEFSVLAHGVEADHVLHGLGLEGSVVDLGPLLVFGHELLSRFLLLVLELGLLLSPLELLLLLLCPAVVDFEEVNDGGVEGLFEEAGLVLHLDGQVGAELGDVEEADFGLLHDLRHQLELGQPLLLDFGRLLHALFALLLLVRLLFGLLLLLLIFAVLEEEGLVGDALVLLEHAVDDEAVGLARVEELDVGLGAGVDVGAVVVVLLDLPERVG
mmetsp:Transcript_16567/g.28189  ORF Transcript_16567/g.28189 Transcript_16567/m.28189 type:complete len:259 (-) Transcript_16567:440-1216(-)